MFSCSTDSRAGQSHFLAFFTVFGPEIKDTVFFTIIRRVYSNVVNHQNNIITVVTDINFWTGEAVEVTYFRRGYPLVLPSYACTAIRSIIAKMS